MRVTPKTDEQIEAERAANLSKYQPWPAGTVCDYEIKEAIDTHTKGKLDDYGTPIEGTKKDMIKAHIDCYNEKGEVKGIITYFGDWNDYHFSSINRERYEAGQVEAEDLLGRTGKCILGIDIGGPKGDGTNYPNKNSIKKFLKPAAPILKVSSPELDDQIPF